MRATEFTAALKQGKGPPVYFLHGPDRFLHEECRAALVAAMPPEARQWCLAEIEFQPGHLSVELQAANQLPMLGGQRILLFSDPDDFRHANDDDHAALQAYLEHPSPFATLVFAALEPDRRRRLIQLLEKKAVVVELRPLARREAAAWLKSYLERYAVAIDPELAEEVVAKFESSGEPGSTPSAGVNLVWMRTEIDKLLTAKADVRRLRREDLEWVVAFREEHEIGRLLLAVAERKLAEALNYLHALLAGKVAETLLMWCIADLFRQALKGGSWAERGALGWQRGKNPFSIWEIAPVAVRRYTQGELLGALRLVRRADLAIKSSWKDSTIILEFLVWQMIMGRSAEGPVPTADDFAASSIDA